jgi:hypothetical protein
MKIHFILIGEGSSDLRLVDHIQNILLEEGFSEVSGEAPDLGMFPNPAGRTVRDKINTLLHHYQNIDAIFVHRDADSAGVTAREQEISNASRGLIPSDRLIPIIPVKMLETWLLTDLEAIKRIAGNSSYRGDLGIPGIRNLENSHDTKQILIDALCQASQTQGARRAKFKKRFTEMRARLTYDLDHNGPVQNLPSYQHFRRKITEFSQSKLYPM